MHGSKMMSNEEIVNYLYKLRASTIRTYVRSRGTRRCPMRRASNIVAAAIAPGMCLVLTAAVSAGDGLALHADTIVV